MTELDVTLKACVLFVLLAGVTINVKTFQGKQKNIKNVEKKFFKTCINVE